MQTPGRRTLAFPLLTLTVLMTLTSVAHAQEQGQSQASQTGQAGSRQPTLTQAQQALAQDFYRAEFVILERKIEPEQVEERMAGRLPEPPDLTTDVVLRHTEESGSTTTTLDLVPQNELHLSDAVRRLNNSGKYRVLLAEGWYQAFPPDFEGQPMWVTLGDWLPGAEHTDVQGMITIDRQRYLHVNVQLNHFVPKSPTDNSLGIDLNAETPSRPPLPRIPIRPASSVAQVESGSAELSSERELVAGLNWPRAELLTWIKETRRMRSEEVHFLDSPTLGVLIFFKKIEPEDAAPLILRLGMSGESVTDGSENPTAQ